jgi:hypothetical protein
MGGRLNNCILYFNTSVADPNATSGAPRFYGVRVDQSGWRTVNLALNQPGNASDCSGLHVPGDGLLVCCSDAPRTLTV